jgi:hypothetical protein
MPISWNEIRQNAIHFASERADAASERSEKQSFWDEFFEVFGMRRRAVASFEEPVKLISGTYGRIDLFWTGMLLVEHKSRGQDLGKAESQAFQYIQDLINEGRQDDVPRYVIVSDFARLALYDLEPEDQRPLPLFAGHRVEATEFSLSDLHRNIHAFAFIAGYQQHRFQDHDPINLKAVAIMDDLHDALEGGGYTGHDLERLLVRILFCLFAQCTGIFEREAFRLFVEERTKPDGSDLGVHLAQLFAVLNTPSNRRQRNLDDVLAGFPYVNGDLFAESLGFANFNRDMRNSLLACTRFDWSQISPAVFGSLFQGTMEKKERRQLGSHYTSERDIMKVVRGLFLDDLRAEFDRVRRNKNQLKQFHQKIARLRFLDPACGCGNFLVVTYRELRLLEIDVLKLLEKGQQHLHIQSLSLVDVDAFYGIEIDEWPARIAEVAMWLMDHQMNIRLSEAFGQYFVRLPLTKSPTIVCGNALRLDWKKEILPPESCSYLLGNPPFVGKKARDSGQQADMEAVFGKARGTGVLDYVCCWYLRAAEYIKGTQIRAAFVSTNSITQGEQPGVLWPILFSFGLKIHFAHRTFAWESEARGKAHVHVVIIGFGAFEITSKRIFDYESNGDSATGNRAGNISPYLIEGGDVTLENRDSPLCGGPRMQFGSMPNDDGNLVLSDADKQSLTEREPEAGPLIRPLLSAHEYLHGEFRWCLWLDGVPPHVIRRSPEVRRRVDAVRAYRLKSGRATTKNLADSPTVFGEIRQPTSRFVLVPRHSSENRRYIPISYFTPNYVPSDSCLFIEKATLYHFGVLSSAVHLAWVRHVCGRIKSDYRYSAKLVYNNFPWPESPTRKQTSTVEAAAQRVLDTREEYLTAGSTLADLYDPLLIPPPLSRAHRDLDRAVDRCYRPKAFVSDRERVEFLFSLYERIIAPLLPKESKKKLRERPRRPRGG